MFERFDGRAQSWKRTDPPDKIIDGLLALRRWDFPQVVGTIGAPTLRPDGSILNAPGYDRATKLWLCSKITLPRIESSERQARDALKLLRELLSGFPFVSKVDRAVALAALLTAVLRGAFDFAPIFAVLAHEMGTGKSFLIDLIANIVTGRDCPVMTGSRSVEELEKRIGALLLEGPPLASLDNLSHDLDGDLLAQMVTQQVVKPRILGKSEIPECGWRGTLFATGNNVRIVGDLVRRSLCCHLDAKLERPELRRFKFSPIERVHQDRATYIAAAITIASAYIKAERIPVTPLGGFMQWSRVVREPLIWLGEADPVISMEETREDDPERMATRELLHHLEKRIGRGIAFSARDLIAQADRLKMTNPDIYRFPHFRALLIEQAGRGHDIDAKRLGRWLQKMIGRVHGDMRIDAKKVRTGNVYVLNKIGGRER